MAVLFTQLRVIAFLNTTISQGSIAARVRCGETFNYSVKAKFHHVDSSLASRRPVRDQIPLCYPACDQLADLLASKTA